MSDDGSPLRSPYASHVSKLITRKKFARSKEEALEVWHIANHSERSRFDLI